MQQGEHDALRMIYDLYAADLLRYGRRFTDDQTQIEDVLHDLFVYIWTNRQRLTPTDSIPRYLMVALRRRILANKKRNHTEELPLSHAGTESSREQQLIIEEGQDQQSNQLHIAMQHLSRRQQEVLHLRFEKGLSYEDIGVVMEIGYQSVRNLVHSAVSKLRVSLIEKNSEL